MGDILITFILLGIISVTIVPSLYIICNSSDLNLRQSLLSSDLNLRQSLLNNYI